MRARFGDGRTPFLVHDTIVQNLPHETANPVRDRSDRLGVSQPHDEPSIEELKDAAFGLHRGVRGLIEEPTHLSVAVRGSVAVIDARAFLMPGTRADPGGEALGGREGRGGGPHFRDDLLRRIHPKPGDLGQPLESILVLAK